MRFASLVVAIAAWASSASAAEVRPRVLGIAHAAFYVDDMKGAVEFYTQFLGYQTPYSLPLPSGGELIWIKINERQSVELFPGAAVAPI